MRQFPVCSVRRSGLRPTTNTSERWRLYGCADGFQEGRYRRTILRVRAYYFTGAQWAYQNLRKKRLKISRFLELNDPFELFAVEQHDPVLRRRMKDWAKRVHAEDGVICLSRSWRNPLMWSHYADRHRGVCLGFDVSDLEKISYQPERLAPGLLTDGPQPPTAWTQLLLTTKFADWEYENEVRILLHLSLMAEEKGLYFKPFDKRLRLVEVIAGARCCIGWQRPLTEAVSEFPGKPKLIKARLSFEQFRVCTQLSESSAQQGYDAEWAWQKCTCKDPRLHALPEGSQSESGPA